MPAARTRLGAQTRRAAVRARRRLDDALHPGPLGRAASRRVRTVTAAPDLATDEDVVLVLRASGLDAARLRDVVLALQQLVVPAPTLVRWVGRHGAGSLPALLGSGLPGRDVVRHLREGTVPTGR